MKRQLLLVCSLHMVLAVLLGLLFIPASAHALTQRDWMIALVDGLGRSFGLPDEPTPEDYVKILSGTRNLRLEAEEVCAEDDEVSRLSYLNYGPLSGSGWLLGVSRPTDVHLRFVLPHDGVYRMTLGAHLTGHSIRAGEARFKVDGDAKGFAAVEAGEVKLAAGPQEIVITLPAGGAIDYLELNAPNLPAVAPQGGWQPEATLNWETLALTAVQALRLGPQLPATERSLVVEAESVADIGGARTVDDTHLGQPSGGRWLRSAAQVTRVVFPLDLAEGGFYDIDLDLIGNPVEVLANDHLALSVAGKTYLETVSLPAVFLPRGANRLTVTLPPDGGIDRIVLKPRQSDLPALAAALGIAPSGGTPTPADLDRLSARLTSSAR